MSKPIPATDAEIKANALSFKAKSDWHDANPSYVHAARKRGIYAECTAHMAPLTCGAHSSYQVYAYLFSDSSFYAGLTRRPKKRHHDHLLGGAVAAQLKAGLTHELVVKAAGIGILEASRLEGAVVAELKGKGLRCLNKGPTGGVGSLYKYDYNLAEALALAATCQSLAEFKKKHYLWNLWATNNGFLAQIVEEGMAKFNWPRPIHGQWQKRKVPQTFEECLEEAKQFKTISEWRGSGYSKAWREGWLPEIKRLAGITKKKAVVSSEGRAKYKAAWVRRKQRALA